MNVEHFAERLALMFNGGGWNSHYTEAQKNLWRARAKAILQGDDWRSTPK